MSDIEPVTNDPWARIEKIEEVGTLYLKGYKNSEICTYTDLAPATVREYIKLYKQRLDHAVEEDPYFLEKVQLNTLKTMAALDEISKEAWESVEIATRDGILAQRNTALKLALDVETKKAALLQLMGGAKTDTEYIARMQKAETVNQMISRVIRDIVSECENCREKARVAMREVFAMMSEDETFTTIDDVDEVLDFEDAEIIEDEEFSDEENA